MKKEFNDAYLWLNLWKAATTYRVYEYDIAMARMVAHNHGMETWIGDRPPKKLSNEHFPTKKYDHTTTSVSESCNNVLKGCKGTTNNTLVEYTRKG